MVSSFKKKQTNYFLPFKLFNIYSCLIIYKWEQNIKELYIFWQFLRKTNFITNLSYRCDEKQTLMVKATSILLFAYSQSIKYSFNANLFHMHYYPLIQCVLTNLYFVLCWKWLISYLGLGRQCLYWNIYAVFVISK